MAITEPVKEADGDEGGMGYLQSLPRRVVTIYVPLLVFVIVLLFPCHMACNLSCKMRKE
jgi:multiple sugar transport system permease protein